jgi:hypothetical protein
MSTSRWGRLINTVRQRAVVRRVRCGNQLASARSILNYSPQQKFQKFGFSVTQQSVNGNENDMFLMKAIHNNAIKFYEYFNAMKFEDLKNLIAEDSRLKDTKKGNFLGLEQVIARLIRVRTKHGDEPWVIGDSEVILDIPAVRTRLQFANSDTHTIVTIVTTLTFDEDQKIAMIYTDRIAEEPI